MERVKIPNIKLHHYFYYFCTYSFVGWLIETVYMSIRLGRIVNRGFLHGPVCPIYGFGALLLLVLLKPLKNNLFLFFSGAVMVLSALEFITSIVLEIIFHKTWWSYSNEAFNLDGRICLKFSLMWGLAAIILLNLLQPHIHYLMTLIPYNKTTIVTFILAFYFTFDFTLVVTNLTLRNVASHPVKTVSSEIQIKTEEFAGTLAHTVSNTLTRLRKLQVGLGIASHPIIFRNTGVQFTYPQKLKISS